MPKSVSVPFGVAVIVSAPGNPLPPLAVVTKPAREPSVTLNAANRPVADDLPEEVIGRLERRSPREIRHQIVDSGRPLLWETAKRQG